MPAFAAGGRVRFGNSMVATIRSEARLDDGTLFVREAVALLRPVPRKPVTFISWRESTAGPVAAAGGSRRNGAALMASSPVSTGSPPPPAWRQKLEAFWRWWTGELAQMVPERFAALGGATRVPQVAVEGDRLVLLEPQGGRCGAGQRRHTPAIRRRPAARCARCWSAPARRAGAPASCWPRTRRW